MTKYFLPNNSLSHRGKYLECQNIEGIHTWEPSLAEITLLIQRFGAKSFHFKLLEKN